MTERETAIVAAVVDPQPPLPRDERAGPRTHAIAAARGATDPLRLWPGCEHGRR